MTILPRLLYLLRSLPIRIPQSFFKQLQSLLIRFLWGHKRPRIKFALLTRPKDRGGMGLPHFQNYYMAAHLTRVIDWHCHGESKDWVRLEESLNQGSLRFSPWIPWRCQQHSVKRHPLTENTMNVLRMVIKKSDLTSQLSPLTPLQDNPEFAPGIDSRTFQSQDPQKRLTVGDCLLNDRIKDYSMPKDDNKLPNLPCWSYFQICSYVTNGAKQPFFQRPLTELEIACQKGDDFNKATSVTYN